MSFKDLPVELTCPLGHTCEELIEKPGGEKVIRKCRWFVHIRGQNPQTHEEVDEVDCAIAWQPILSLEMSRTNRGQTQAIESFRNAVVAQNDQLIQNQVEVENLPQVDKVIKLEVDSNGQ